MKPVSWIEVVERELARVSGIETPTKQNEMEREVAGDTLSVSILREAAAAAAEERFTASGGG